MKTKLSAAFALVLCALCMQWPARAQTPPPPDESILGTVEVDGSSTGTLPPLPKLAMVPLSTIETADTMLAYVVRRDLELSGQFQVQELKDAPMGPFSRDVPLDLPAFAEKGAEYVVRAYGEKVGANTKLIAEAYLTPKPGTKAPEGPLVMPKPAYKGFVEAKDNALRMGAHRLVDELLGALTGRPGGFASQMTYAGRVGKWRQAFVLDADGFNLHEAGPTGVTVLSPAFGPGGHLFYALSRDYSPFTVAATDKGITFPMVVPGSVLGLAFSSDQKKMALTVMSEGQSTLWTAEGNKLSRLDAASHANHPVFGPLGKVAYVGGTPVQRVYVDGKPISPPGFMASAPVFCDAPDGLLVLFTVDVAGGADVIAMDAQGGSLRRLTQKQGSNAYPACSPDGRLVSFFSTSKGGGKGDGLFVMPIQRPWLAKKISSETGESLHWSRPQGR
jgi:TolB protein